MSEGETEKGGIKMRIEFNCKKIVLLGENPNALWINTALFKNKKTGEIVTMDRNQTEYSIKDDTIEILWRDVYRWDGEEEQYDMDPDNFCKEYEWIGFEYDEDDETYEAEVIDWISYNS